MIIDFFANLSRDYSDPSTLEHVIAQYHQSIAAKDKEKTDEIREKWKMDNMSKKIDTRSNSLFGLIQYPKIDISYLPEYSFILQFKFTLKKPYISRDEQDFYIIDNPIRKDKVFGHPYVAPSSWKGSLKAALWQLGHKADNEEIRRIFGNERSAEEHERIRAGRLHLFPTFFSEKSLEIINPHDRERRVGTIPIFIESVPANTSGLFTLLYVPFDLIGKEENVTKKQMVEDIQLINSGLNAMFMDYGFGAKTSSGYGIAKSDVTDGLITLKACNIETSPKDIENLHPPEEAFEKYLNEDGSVIEDFKGGGDVGLLSNSKYDKKRQNLGGGSGTEFAKFRRWYGGYGELWQKSLRLKNAMTYGLSIWRFMNFEELIALDSEIEKSFNYQEPSQ
jgi:CRISPR-associated protein Cmr2